MVITKRPSELELPLPLPATLTGEFYPDGANKIDSGGRPIGWASALARLNGTTRPAYLLLPVSARHWPQLLQALGVHEPDAIRARRQRPEGECAAALLQANRSVQFERALRWRLLSLGGASGAGMHLHVDSPPVSGWHHQVRGEKRWRLCPPAPAHAYCGGDVDIFGVASSTVAACPAFRPHACLDAALRPGESLFCPEGWWHATRTEDAGALSLSRNLVTRSNAAPLAAALGTYCAEARRVAADRFGAMCDALAPCLARLATVRDDAEGGGRPRCEG